MKTLPILLLLAGMTAAMAQQARPQIIDRGPHSRTWQWEEDVTWPDGRIVRQPHQYVELATGLNYQDEQGQWQESRELIEPSKDGAVARHGQHRMMFAPNLNTRGAIDLEAPDGQRFQSHVLGLAYFDTATGKSVMIAEVKDAIGEILPPNQVIYRDAFDTVKASVRYTYTRAGMEQDILLEQVPPPPEDFGLISASTRLDVFTEFVAAPAPVIRQDVLRARPDAVLGQPMAAPELVDSSLDFGSLNIGSGEAFSISGDRRAAVPVVKSWQVIEGRTFLIESVELPDLQTLLKELPRAALPTGEKTAKIRVPADGRRQMVAALRRPGPAPTEQQSMLLASAPLPQRAVVLDYRTLNGSLTNYVFNGDMTYYLSAPVTVYGQTRLEGGAVLKYARNAKLDIKGALVSATDLSRPAILTACDDATVGENTATGTLQGTYASPALYFDYYASSSPASVQNIRVLYAGLAFQFFGGSGHEIRHAQLINCASGASAYYAYFAFRNALFWNVTNAFSGSSSGSYATCENITFDGGSTLSSSFSGMNFANCLLTGISNTNGLTGLSNVVLSSATGVYQTVGGGYHYLAENSPYRDRGSTNGNTNLLAELKFRTTYPPVLLNNAITTDTVLSPQAGRDTDLPDIGYHYAPLDFLISAVTVRSNATVLATNGVAIGIDYFVTNSWGFLLAPGKFLSQGSPVAMNRVVRAHTVQEKASGNPGTRACFYDGNTPGGSASTLRARFTEFDQMANDGYLLYTGTKFDAVELTHSAVYNPSLVIDFSGTGTLVVGLTNTLWERGGVQLGTSTASTNKVMHGRNNLWRNVSLLFYGGNTNWTVADEIFDRMYRVTNINGPVLNYTNAWYLTNYGLSGGLGIIQLTNLTYDVGPLGSYYRPTNSTQLINKGSRTADLAQLYHFTTTTNQVKETNSIVDIGLHYVAVTNIAGVWVPIDTDGDGVPDYIEDANGNGTVDGGERSWTAAPTQQSDTSGVLRLQLHTPVK